MSGHQDLTLHDVYLFDAGVTAGRLEAHETAEALLYVFGAICPATAYVEPMQAARRIVDQYVRTEGLLIAEVERLARDLEVAIETKLEIYARWERVTKHRDAAEAGYFEMRELVRRVRDMGGTPDLFAPVAGWDQWEDDADAALQRRPPLLPREMGEP